MNALVVVVFLLSLGVELRWPGRSLPRVKYWYVKGLLFFGLSGLLAAILLPWWITTLSPHRIVDLSGLGTVGGALVGYVLFQFFAYWYHRSEHRFNFMWLMGHQLHHSAERVDTVGAFYFHPIETSVYSFFSAGAPALLGINPNAIALLSFIGLSYAVFQHTNVRTPRWLGYIIQRPESHGFHHRRGVHAFNYADLPLWDIIFGTFRNPEMFEEKEYGYWDGASAKLGQMLLFQDVSKPPVEQASVQPAPQSAN